MDGIDILIAFMGGFMLIGVAIALFEQMQLWAWIGLIGLGMTFIGVGVLLWKNARKGR